MGLLTKFDAVAVDNIPSSARYVALYVDGSFPNLDAGKARCPDADVLTITVVPADIGECCDCETGDLTVAQAEAWVEQRLAAGVYRPCVYADASRWSEQLLGGLAKYGGRIRRWVAAFPGTGPNVPDGFDAHQYSTGDLDTSACLADFFDSAPPKPVDPTVRWASSELQVSIPEGTTGILRFNGTFDVDNGVWGVGGDPGKDVHWSGPGGGKWRVTGEPWNQKP